MDRSVGTAAKLPENDRRDLAIQALAGSVRVSDLAARHGVSRKFVYAQTHKARAALDDAFLTDTAEDEVLFELTGRLHSRPLTRKRPRTPQLAQPARPVHLDRPPSRLPADGRGLPVSKG